MNLKNYTSSVSAIHTLSLIESYLIECGATGIAKQIADGQVQALMFQIPDERGKMRTVKLPANIVGVQEVMWSDYLRGVTRPRKSKEDFAQQAERTAWKIQLDWVQVQMSLIKLRQVEVMQAFLAYLWDGGQTYYEFLKGSNFKQLPQAT